jgi:hypothetical protein
MFDRGSKERESLGHKLRGGEVDVVLERKLEAGQLREHGGRNWGSSHGRDGWRTFSEGVTYQGV